jgi:thiol-disulfide isomerase/thioredoxin
VPLSLMSALSLCAPAAAGPEMIPLEVFEAARRAAPEAGAAAVEIPLRDGSTFRLAEHAGSPVLLTFWASWCGPCRLELPALSAWSQQHPEVHVVAVNVDRTRPPAERFLQSVLVGLPVAFDPEAKHLGQYGAISMPTMFLFDGRGQLAWQHTGYSQEKGFAELEQALLGVR